MPQEKLIDDVMAFICEHGIVAQGYVGFRREDAKQLIDLVAKGPLPGEVGRGKVKRKTKGGRFPIVGDDCENPSGWILEKGWLQSFDDLYDMETLPIIALSGTKEEEK